MKKLLALTLALLMTVSMFAACDNKAATTTQAPAGDATTVPQAAPSTPAGSDATTPDATTPDATTPVATEPTVTEPVATEPVDEKYIVVDKLNKHENGWNQDNFGNGSHGVFFSLKSNDAPFEIEGAPAYYDSTDFDTVLLYRDGEVYEIGTPNHDNISKVDKNGYYLRLENWVIDDEYLPIVNGDVILLSGDFYNADSGYTLHFEPVYLIFNGDMVKFSTTAPEGIE